MNIKQSFLAVCLLLFVAGVDCVWAQNSNRFSYATTPYFTQKQVSAGTPIYFRIGNSRLDMDFKQNRYNLDVLLRSVNAIVSDTNYVIKNFTVTGTASPDGGVARNTELAGQRARALYDWLSANVQASVGKINVVNGGENWTALREMVAASQMPYRNEILIVIDTYAHDHETLKYLLKTYADGEPWRWMTENIFPELRMGAGLSKVSEVLSLTSLENWQVLRGLVVADTKVLSAQEKRDVLYVIDNMADAVASERQLKHLNFGSTYVSIRQSMFSPMLNNFDNQTISNWVFIRAKVSASDMKHKAEVLSIIDNVPIYEGREKQLMQLDAGVSYNYLKENIFPQLLTTSSLISQRNWALIGKLVEVSDAPNKELLLELCKSPYSSAEKESKLKAMNAGRDYTYIYRVIFPELLCLLTPTSTDNWRQLQALVNQLSLVNKNEVLDIIENVSVADGRQGAIIALDKGAAFGAIQSAMFPLMLTATEISHIPISGSGISVNYELSSAARARQAMLAKQDQTTDISEGNQSETSKIGVLKKKQQKALLNIKTDLVQWAGVTSAFDGLHTYTPNLSLEFMFAGRWSVEAGYSYSNWNSFTGSKELWAVSQGWIEPRVYVGKSGLFRGFYAGVYGLYGSYDVQEGLTGHTGTHINVGVSVGYVQTLSRSWYLELGLRGGYRMGKGAFYDIADGHYYHNTDNEKGQFAPQVRLNLTCRIFRNSR